MLTESVPEPTCHSRKFHSSIHKKSSFEMAGTKRETVDGISSCYSFVWKFGIIGITSCWVIIIVLYMMVLGPLKLSTSSVYLPSQSGIFRLRARNDAASSSEFSRIIVKEKRVVCWSQGVRTQMLKLGIIICVPFSTYCYRLYYLQYRQNAPNWELLNPST